MNKKPWTDHDDDRLRALVAAGREHAAIAGELGRTRLAIKCRCVRLGLLSRRRFTPADVAFLREHYGTMPARELARRLGRSVTVVYQKADKLGLCEERKRWDPSLGEQLRRLNAEGNSDTEVARILGFERHTVTRHRKRLGLPDQSYGPQSRASLRAGVRRQLDRLGIASMNQLRVESWRKLARERGWPDEVCGRKVCHRHVQILEALWHRGPQTRQQIAEAIGMPWKGSSKSLVSNDKGGSYLAALMRAGLVVSLGRVARGQGRGKSVQLYSLAMDVERGNTDAG